MGYLDVTHEAILKAIKEYDDLGRDHFLATYGFGRARSYWLVYNGKKYDSKAVVGVAHRFLPDRQALTPKQLIGGDKTVKRHLERLGFTVEVEAFVGSEQARPDIVHEEEPKPLRSRSGYELSDYLDPKPEKTRLQFQSLLEREPVPQGKKQGDYLPVETLLCFAASFVVDPGKYGGANEDRVLEPVPTLEFLFKRPRSSILDKMRNLYGVNGRSKGNVLEPEVGRQLQRDSANFVCVYQMLLRAARAAGIGSDRLPDFLDLTDDDNLLGQEEIGPAELDQAQAEFEADALDSETERSLAMTVRLRQHFFAKKVRENCGDRCVFCGFSPLAFEGRRMLMAGHIKPWRKSTPRERLDHRNGLAACPTHDAAFDTGLITVDENLAIRVSGMLAAAIDTDPAVRQYFGRPPLFETLQLPPGADQPSPDYLAWHRQNIFNRSQGA